MQTEVENTQARTIRVSSRNHFRRRNKRDEVRARIVKLQMICGIRMPKRIPGRVDDIDVLAW